jgi:hypothetical protein
MNYRSTRVLVAAILMSLSQVVYAQIPRLISYQGMAEKNGQVVSGPHLIRVTFYDSLIGGNVLFEESHQTNFERGIFTVLLGSQVVFPPSLQFDRSYFLGVSLDGEPELSPRTMFVSAPYALHAERAELAKGLTADAHGVVTSINELSGSVRIVGDSTTSITHNGNEIRIHTRLVTVGIRSLTSPDATIDIINSTGPSVEIGVADNAITSKKLRDGAVTLSKFAQDGATNGQIIKWNGSRWVVADDGGVNYTAGQGISITNNVISSTGGLPAGTLLNTTLRWNGTLWTENLNLLSDANGNTLIKGTATLGDGTGVDNIFLRPGTGTVRVETFGTGIIKSGVSGILTSGLVDLTSDVTGVLSVSHGGTGVNTLPIGAFLVGNGTNPVSTTTLTAGSGITLTPGAGILTIASTNSAGWLLTGNAGTTSGTNFIGTTDNQRMFIQVRNGATVNNSLILNTNGSIQRDAGGNARGAYALDLQIDRTNMTDVASGANAVIAGGKNNGASGFAATVSGGEGNGVTGQYGTVSGGLGNGAGGQNATVSGGYQNIARADFSTVSGGRTNDAAGVYSSILGGSYLKLGANSVGYNKEAGSSITDLSGLNSLAYFGNVNLFLGNTDNVARELRFYSPNTSFTLSGAKFTGFKAGSQTNDIIYSLPITQPTSNQVLSATNITGTGPYNVTLGWSNAGTSNDWALTGNNGTTVGTNFLGTTDNQSFEIHVYETDAASKGSKRVMRFEPNAWSANIIGGYQGNTATGVVGATIAGGGTFSDVNSVTGDYGAIGGGSENTAYSWSTVMGGTGNSAAAIGTVIGGGSYNTAGGAHAAIGGGDHNNAGATESTISGGAANVIHTDAQFATISGGGSNNAIGNSSSIVGGVNNQADTLSTVLGGSRLKLGARSVGYNGAYYPTTSIVDLSASTFSGVAYFGNVNMMIGNVDNAARQLRFYEPNTSLTFSGTNFSSFQVSTQSADILYTLPTAQPTANQVLAATAITGTGPYNVSLGWANGSVSAWNLTGNSGTTAGTNFLGTTDNQPFEIQVYSGDAAQKGSRRVMRFEPNAVSANVILGHYSNYTLGGVVGAMISGGSFGGANSVSGNFGTVAGGTGNTANLYSTVSGGASNRALANYGVLAGGNVNALISGLYSSISGGAYNNIEGSNSTIAGGYGLTLEADNSFGFAGAVGSSNPVTIVADNTAFFGNVDLWLGSISGTAPSLKLFEAQNTNGAFPATGTNYSAFRAGTQSADITYTLPGAQPTTNQVLAATAITGTGPYNVTLGWANGGGNAWNLTGNSGTTAGTNFLGTTDNQPLEFHVYSSDAAQKGSRRVMRFEPNATSANIILGHYSNYTSANVVGAMIGGGAFGGANSVGGNFGTVAGGIGNTANSYSTVSGGAVNQALANYGVIGGGYVNTLISGLYSSISGGAYNNIEGNNSTIAGGYGLTLEANNSFGFFAGVGSSNGATIVANNTAFFGNVDLWLGNVTGTAPSLKLFEAQSTSGAFPATGTNYSAFRAGTQSTDITYTLPGAQPTTNQVLAATAITGSGPYSVTLGWANGGGSAWNLTGNSGTTAGTNFVGTTDNQPFEIHIYESDAANKGSRRVMRFEPKGTSPNVIAGYSGNFVASGKEGATISGGGHSGNVNKAEDHWTTVSGGYNNTAWGLGSTIGGGYANIDSSSAGVIAGGTNNFLTNVNYATISGGGSNSVRADGGFIGGGTTNAVYANRSVIVGGSLNRVFTGAEFSSIGGGFTNRANGLYSVIGGGGEDSTNAQYATVGGGYRNNAAGYGSVIAGGDSNKVYAGSSAIAGGWRNKIFSGAQFGSIGGGSANLVTGASATIAGGSENRAGGDYATVGGGSNNYAVGSSSTISGGNNNRVSSYSAIAGGSFLNLAGTGSFGFHSGSAVADSAFVTASNTAFFGNVNMWLGNTNNTASQLRFYEPQNGGVTFPAATTNFSSFATGTQSTDIQYILPLTQPSADQVLTATAVSGSGPYNVTLGWTNGGGSGWNLTGNSGTTAGTNFLGTIDNQPIEIHAYNSYSTSNQGTGRVLRIEPKTGANSSPNIIAGYQGNTVSSGVVGATISGGGYGTSFTNSVSANFGTVTGGYLNTASGGGSVVSGGSNTASGTVSAVVGGSNNGALGNWSTVGGGYQNLANGDYSFIAGGYNLYLGDHSFGFSGRSSTSSWGITYLTSYDNVAYFGNVDLMIGNSDGTSREVRFFGPTNQHYTNVNYVALKAGTPSVVASYTLPDTLPTATGNVLLSDANGIMNWSTGMVWDRTNSRLGVGTSSPSHPLHSVNNATTDEKASVYGNNSGSTTDQAIGVWGDASNSGASNTGTIGVLATGNGNTSAGQTNIALQINDGALAMGRTTEAPTTGTTVSGATSGTAYSAQGPSGVIELTLGATGNLTTVAPTAGTPQDLGSVTINNKYCAAGSIVLVNVIDFTDGGAAPDVHDAAFIVNVDNTTTGSFDIRTKMIPTVTSASNYTTTDKVRIGYIIVNPSK